MHTKVKKSRPLNRAERRNASIPGRLSGWESHLRATGGKVPDRPNHPGEPYYHAIGQAIGVSGQAVKKYANRIEKLAADIGFEPCEPETRKDPQPVMPRLTRYFDSLRASGKKVPVNIAHPDQPDFALIGREIEVDSWVLRAGHFLYRKVILEVVAELGLEKIEPMAIGDAPITIAELEGAIRRDCDSGVTDNDAPMTEKQRRGANSNTSWALNRLAGSSYAASLSAAARPALDAAIAALSGKPGEDRRWLAELKKCALALDRIEKDGLPVSLAAALNFAIGRSGLPRAAIAREIDIHEVVLADWTCGRRNPCRDALTKLAALEKYLCLSPRALTIRYRSTARGPKVVDPKGRTRRTSPGAASATAGRKRGKDREPDSLFPRDWPLERDPDGKLIYTHQSAWPEALRRERDQFMLFRSVAKAPLGMTRNGDLWSPGTTSMRDSEIGRLFSDIATKYKEFEGKPELLTFALFAFPLFLDTYITRRHRKRTQKTGKDRLTTMDIAMMRLSRAMVHPESGWVTQMPALAKRLIPVWDPNTDAWLISPEDVAAGPADWPAKCQKAYTLYDQMVGSNEKAVSIESDKPSINAILRLEDPYEAFRLGLRGLASEIAGLKRGSHAYCIAVRDRFLWGIASQAAFRAENFELTYDENNEGEVRFVGEDLVVGVPYWKFKNKEGPYFKIGENKYRNYYKVLLDMDDLYDTAREYIYYVRPILLKGNTSSFLFISHLGATHITAKGLGQAISSNYRRFVMWNPEKKTGIEGAKPTGPHWVRAVLATAVYKRTGSMQLAADAIHDSVETVLNFYVSSLPEDREKLLDNALRDSLSGKPVEARDKQHLLPKPRKPGKPRKPRGRRR